MRGKCLILLFLGILQFAVGQQKEELNKSAYQLLNLPDLAGEKFSGQIVIAVIDDGFLIDHKELNEFYWFNKSEIPDNNIDDDKNGYVDDIYGWDVADGDNDVQPGKEVIESYNHGTMIASIIAMVVKQSIGANAPINVKIMPIKALSDFASRNTLEEGYKGLEYAIANKADIICMAWNGGTITAEEASKFTQATSQGILLLASAGNESTNKLPPPAGLKSVYSVAAIDQNYKKIHLSNYDEDVDLVAFGDEVKAAHSIANNAYYNAGGTSSAVALVAGCAAILKVAYPTKSPLEIIDALRNTAEPLDYFNMRYLARLGAGLPNVSAAFNYLNNQEGRLQSYNPDRTKGNFFIQNKDGVMNKKIELPIGLKEVKISLKQAHKFPRKAKIQVRIDENVILNSSLTDVDPYIRIPGNSFSVDILDYTSKQPLEFSYSSTPYDSINMYCSGTTVLEGDSGTISDGSGKFTYANNVSCKWVVKVDESKRVKLTFTELDTEENSDQVLIFHGNHPLQENLIANFSGTTLPPTIVSSYNEVLIWFITNDTVTKKGWHLRYSATDEAPGVK